jgi:2-polyprenyl-3-methyl-5-hydroxy-6-metoxy-1,4-benzoquinol methylase
MGMALQRQGKLKEAIKAYNKALAIKPDYADAYNNMGVILQDQGMREEAIEAYTRALSIKPDYAEAYNNMGNSLKGIVFQRTNPDLQKTIGLLLDQRTRIQTNDVATAAISLLRLEPKLQKHLLALAIDKPKQALQQTVLDLSELPLLLKLMSIHPLADLELENLLKEVRAGILSALPSLEVTSDILKFQSALALQCFTNEYIYDQSKDEEKAIKALENSIGTSLSKGEKASPQVILCLASYKALHEYKWCDLLCDSSDIHQVFTRQVSEPRQETQLKSNIPMLEEINDDVSVKVRAQYEDNPYPRWVNLGLPLNSKPISKVVDQAKIKLFDNEICEVSAPDIMVAGCGTGQHSIDTAAEFKNSKVLAIDLSLSSLAYAKRKTEELGVTNIEYMHADILKLAKLDRQFDIIESAGVLHHMDNPMAGWKALVDCLRDGGLMKIGLYSELARQKHATIRAEINESAIKYTKKEMKSFRKDIISSHRQHHMEIRLRQDFYSLSNFRDLLFHVQEYRFTIPQLKQCLEELGLKFCGFEKESIVQKFRLSNTGSNDPYDLDKWQRYEEANPRTFGSMYQFWCQKVG